MSQASKPAILDKLVNCALLKDDKEMKQYFEIVSHLFIVILLCLHPKCWPIQSSLPTTSSIHKFHYQM